MFGPGRAGWDVVRDEGARAHPGFHQAVRHQQLIGSDDRVPPHAELGGQCAAGRQAAAGREPSSKNRVTQGLVDARGAWAVHPLQVQRQVQHASPDQLDSLSGRIGRY